MPARSCSSSRRGSACPTSRYRCPPGRAGCRIEFAAGCVAAALPRRDSRRERRHRKDAGADEKRAAILSDTEDAVPRNPLFSCCGQVRWMPGYIRCSRTLTLSPSGQPGDARKHAQSWTKVRCGASRRVLEVPDNGHFGAGGDRLAALRRGLPSPMSPDMIAGGGVEALRAGTSRDRAFAGRALGRDREPHLGGAGFAQPLGLRRIGRRRMRPRHGLKPGRRWKDGGGRGGKRRAAGSDRLWLRQAAAEWPRRRRRRCWSGCGDRRRVLRNGWVRRPAAALAAGRWDSARRRQGGGAMGLGAAAVGGGGATGFGAAMVGARRGDRSWARHRWRRFRPGDAPGWRRSLLRAGFGDGGDRRLRLDGGPGKGGNRHRRRARRTCRQEIA